MIISLLCVQGFLLWWVEPVLLCNAETSLLRKNDDMCNTTQTQNTIVLQVLLSSTLWLVQQFGGSFMSVQFS